MSSKNLLPELNSLIKEDLVKKSDHPTLPITIYNYTNKTQFRKEWTPLTLLCRGLVVEQGTGRVVGRPMPKFFNYTENQHTASDDSPFTIAQKFDGSLGIWFFYKGQWVMATRGSFTSPQAIVGMKMARDAILDQKCDKWKTYCFEIIHPKHRVVVNYGKEEKLVLLAVLNTSTGYDTPSTELPEIAKNLAIECAKDISQDFSDRTIEDWKTFDEPGKEGHVLRFQNGERVKIKFESYLKLHRSAAFSPIKFLDVILDRKNKGKDIATFLKDIPDEFYDEAKDIKRRADEQLEESREKFKEYIEKYQYSEFSKIPTSIPGNSCIVKYMSWKRNPKKKSEEELKSVEVEYCVLITKTVLRAKFKSG